MYKYTSFISRAKFECEKSLARDKKKREALRAAVSPHKFKMQMFDFRKGYKLKIRRLTTWRNCGPTWTPKHLEVIE